MMMMMASLSLQWWMERWLALTSRVGEIEEELAWQKTRCGV